MLSTMPSATIAQPGNAAGRARRLAMYNDNALKIGLFGANCSSGRSATTVPERWAASWPECLALARLAEASRIGHAGVFGGIARRSSLPFDSADRPRSGVRRRGIGLRGRREEPP